MNLSKTNSIATARLWPKRLLTLCICCFWGACFSQTLSDTSNSMFISEGTIVTEGSEIYVAKTSASNKDKKITKLSLKKPAHLLADKKEKAKQNKKRTDVTNEIKTNLIYRYPAHNHFFYAGSFAKSCVVIQGNDRPKMPAPPENFYTLSDIKAENNIKTQFFIYGMSPGQKGIFTKRYCRPPPKSFS